MRACQGNKGIEENHNSKRPMHSNVHSSTTCNNQDMEATVSPDRWMSEMMWCIDDEILCGHEKEWNKWTYLQNKDRLKDIENKHKHGYQRRRGGGVS